jgi:TetR/AcrR family transcriptional regulator
MNGVAQRSGGRVRQGNEALILAAAEATFAEYGFRGASMGMIALRAGLPKANLHYYFGNKQALYMAVLGRILRLWTDSFDGLGADDEPAEALARYIRNKLEFSWRNPLASKVFAMEVISGGACLEAHFNQDFRDWFHGRVQVFRAWSAAGKMDPVDPVHLVFLLWSSTQHYADFATQIGAILGQPGGIEPELEEICANLTTIILKGCGLKGGGARQSLANSTAVSSSLCSMGARLGME